MASGRLWLTHLGDGRDYLPVAGEVITGGSESVIEGLEDSILHTVTGSEFERPMR